MNKKKLFFFSKIKFLHFLQEKPSVEAQSRLKVYILPWQTGCIFKSIFSF